MNQLIKIAQKNKLRKIYIYYHNGKNYDNLIIADHVDYDVFRIHKNQQIKGNSIIPRFVHIKSNI